MDSYNAKLHTMQQYVPFLDKMIAKLEKVNKEHPELAKMRSLHAILTDSTKKVRMDTLLKCEDVIQKLYEKVEGVPFSSLRNYSTLPDTPASPDQSSPQETYSAKSGQRSISPPRSPSPNQRERSLSSYLMSMHDAQHNSSIPPINEAQRNRPGTMQDHQQNSNRPGSMQDGSNSNRKLGAMQDVQQYSNRSTNSNRRRGLLGEAPGSGGETQGSNNQRQDPGNTEKPWGAQARTNPWMGSQESQSRGENQFRNPNEQGQFKSSSELGEKFGGFNAQGGQFRGQNTQGGQLRGPGGNYRGSRDQDQPRGPNYREQENPFGGNQRQWNSQINNRNNQDPWGQREGSEQGGQFRGQNEQSQYRGLGEQGGQYRGPNEQQGKHRGPSEQGGQFRGPSEQQGQHRGPSEQQGQHRDPSEQGGQFRGHSELGGQFRGRNDQGGQFRGPTEQGGQYRDATEQGGQFRGPTEQEGQYRDTSEQGGQFRGQNQPVGPNFRNQEDQFVGNQRQWSNQGNRNSPWGAQNNQNNWNNQTSQSFSDLQGGDRTSRDNRESFERENRPIGDEREHRRSFERENRSFRDQGENRGSFGRGNRPNSEADRGNKPFGDNDRSSFEREFNNRNPWQSQGNQRVSSQERQRFEDQYPNPTGRSSASLERDRVRNSLEREQGRNSNIRNQRNQGDTPLSPPMHTSDTPLSPPVHAMDTPLSPSDTPLSPSDTPQSPPMLTSQSPPMYTPQSPDSLAAPPWYERHKDKKEMTPKVIPLEPKAIPLEREGSISVSFSKEDLKPQETVKRSEEERKNRLLKLMSKLDKKERKGKEFSPNLLVTSSSSSSGDSNKSVSKAPPAVSSSWTPLLITPDSPEHSLEIADTPTSPDTPVSPDTQMVSPDTRGSPGSPASPCLEIPSTPASPDTNEPESNTPASPEQSYEDVKEIPTIPLAPDSSGSICLEKIEKMHKPVEKMHKPQTKVQQSKPEITGRKRDPRSRKDEAKISRDPRFRDKATPESQSSPCSSSNQPAYMSNLVPSHPPPRLAAWTPHPGPTHPGPPIVPPPHAINHRAPSYQVPPPTIPGMRYPPPVSHPPTRQYQPPLSYREHRKLKEEAEKKQREAEKKFREEENNKKQELEEKDLTKIEDCVGKEIINVVEPVHSYIPSTSKNFAQGKKINDGKDKMFRIPKVVKSEPVIPVVKELKARDKIQKQFKEAEVKKEEIVVDKFPTPVPATSTGSKGVKKIEKFVTKTETKTKKNSFGSKKSSGSKFFFPEEDSSDDDEKKQIIQKKKVKQIIDKKVKEPKGSSEDDEDKVELIPKIKVKQNIKDPRIKNKFNKLLESSEDEKGISKKKVQEKVKDQKVKTDKKAPEDTSDEEMDIAEVIPKKKVRRSVRDVKVKVEVNEPVETVTDSETLIRKTPEPLEVLDSTPPGTDSSYSTVLLPLVDTDSEPELTIAEERRQSIESSNRQSIESRRESIETIQHSTKTKIEIKVIKQEQRMSMELKSDDSPKDAHTNVKEIDTKEEIDEIVPSSHSFKDIVPTKQYLTKEEKDDLTKELLKNIVSSLEPDEAKKLLEKASLLDKVEKVSLKELKLLLVASDQESSELEEEVKKKEIKRPSKTGKGRGKVKSKAAKKSPPKPEPRVGTRRSGRLQIPELEEKEEESASEIEDAIASEKEEEIASEKEDEIVSEKDISERVYDLSESFKEEESKEESEYETFVIEPKKVSRKGKQKKGKGKRGRKMEREEEVQDDCVSSSTNKEDITEEPMEEVKVEPTVEPKNEPMEEDLAAKVVIKEESQNENEVQLNEEEKKEEKELSIKIDPEIQPEEEIKSPTSKPGMRQTRSRMAPKSKTWFPGNVLSGGQSKMAKALMSPDHKKEDVAIKKEVLEADLKVFLGEGEVTKKEFLQNTFNYNEGNFNKERFNEKKERHKNVFEILQKLETVEVKSEGKKEEKEEIPLKLCSKIKLRRPSRIRPFLLPYVPPSTPLDYTKGIDSTISKLAQKIKLRQKQEMELDDNSERALDDNSERVLDDNMEESVNFLDLIRDIQRRNQRKKQPPPPLIPLFGPSASGSSSISLKPDERSSFACVPVTPCPGLSYKTQETYLQMLNSPKIQHLFKCMSSTCAFTSNRPTEFRQHLCSHGCVDKNASLCCYCGSRFRGAKELVGHILSCHGESQVQCPHCFYRTGDQAKVLIHQTVFHKSLPRGFLLCKALPNSVPTIQFQAKDLAPLNCLHQNCNFQTEGENISKWQDHDKDHSSILSDFQCAYCRYITTSQIKLVSHQFLQHPLVPVKMVARHFESSAIDDVSSDSDDKNTQEESSVESDDDDEVNEESDEDSGDGINDLLDYDFIEAKAEETIEEKGLSGYSLYRCGNSECDYSSQSVSSFRDHGLVCEFSEIQFNCFHCPKQFKYLPSLLDHLKTHGVKRFSCGLCNYKCSLQTSVKNHLKLVHKVTQIKMLPVNKSKNNQDEDSFVIVPKNAVFKQQRSKNVKDTFTPEEVQTVPIKPDIYRYYIRCSVCDFSTKVRFNLVKHLKLHLAGMDTPDITPVNPSPIVDEGFENNYSRMKKNNGRMQNSLPTEEEEGEMQVPLSDAIMNLMPVAIPENLRFTCSSPDCRYMTIDESMLTYHIKALHPDLQLYSCPHCEDIGVEIDEISTHLNCHGDFLYKCSYCMYYHWQKRTAEKHISDVHKGKIVFVKDVRAEADIKDKLKMLAATRKKKDCPSVHKPYKCGLCDAADENISGIKKHCQEVHEIDKQFKCGLCDEASNVKSAVENHFSNVHKESVFSMLKVYHVDPTTNSELVNEERRLPLWSRGMERLKHIRGILFDENGGQDKVKKGPIKKRKQLEQDIIVIEGPVEHDQIIETKKSSKKIAAFKTQSQISKAKLDYYPMKCKQCNVSKKTITGLKMHIKLIHMHLGKFQCKHCNFTANIKGTIQGHYKNKHPDSNKDSEELFEFNERNSEAKTYNQEFWKLNWDIPTLGERSSLLENLTEVKAKEDGNEDSAKRKDLDIDEKVALQIPPSKKRKVGQKRGRKRKTEAKNVDLLEKSGGENEASDKKVKRDEVGEVGEIKPLEMSPFESCRSYKCGYCPKRSQNLDAINRHHQEIHMKHPFEYLELSRDQVVNMITNDQVHGGSSLEYKCFYCHELGDIIKLKTHTESVHLGQALKVTKFQNSKTTGYLECQLCGYLSSGFEKSKQKAHFHEEHPLEGDVNCSKYTSKVKMGPDAFTSPNQTFKFDIREVEGLTFHCPLGCFDSSIASAAAAPAANVSDFIKNESLTEETCSFSTKTLSQMNNHLRKHTRTYKCGHCGKTLPDSSEFHRHSALSHGDKIPDLVKDPEAEAEYEGLKGLLEWTIQKELAERKSRMQQVAAQSTKVSKIVARKSTTPYSKLRAGDKCRNVATKSTGGGSRFWPETRIEIPYSFYKIEMEKIDPRTVKTRMTMGGMEITFDAEKMGQLINLEPQLVLKDQHYDKESIHLDDI